LHPPDNKRDWEAKSLIMDKDFLAAILSQRILPAVTFEKEEHILPVAEALVKAGLLTMEIPFRTGIASNAIELIRKKFPEINIGAGTLLSPSQVKEANNAGAQFGLSPGFNQQVCDESARYQLPFIPGVMTPSEIEIACSQGYTILKLFPAEQLGGLAFLKAMQGPYEQLKVQFIPMGGVNINNLKEYISLRNVIAVGGSWIATKELMNQKDYKTIEENARKAISK
jgi:2-dehydro-3-deoxyphosphogluconate aldolase/(4S)-4-hydroxy-2-oxoglutarate aldolase